MIDAPNAIAIAAVVVPILAAMAFGYLRQARQIARLVAQSESGERWHAQIGRKIEHIEGKIDKIRDEKSEVTDRVSRIEGRLNGSTFK